MLLLVATKITLTVDTSKTFQKIIGFGGAFTDAASINVFNLSQATRQNFVNAYFGPQGKVDKTELQKISRVLSPKDANFRFKKARFLKSRKTLFL